MNPSVKYFSQEFEAHRDNIFDDFFNYLRFPSISTSSQHKQDILDCANFVQNYLQDMHFEVQRWETLGHPCIFAQNLNAGDNAPTLLIYLHYDVQPVDPLELWETPPFEPTLKNGKIYARGASDNKGQAFFTLSALKAIYKKHQKYPLNLKIIIEGEEEVGSSHLYPLLEEKKQYLNADYLAVVDVDIPSEDNPTANLGCRGIYTCELHLKGSASDLHSGLYGGVVYNPLRALSEIFAKMYDQDGRVTIPGFYDHLYELSEEEKKDFFLSFDQKAFEKEHQTLANGGEHAFSPLERMGLRPTFEINGIWGGYIHEGFKTVIPSLACAKVSMRLIPNQDPQKIADLFAAHIQSLVPPGLTLKIIPESLPARALWCDFNSEVVKAAQWAFEQVTQKPCKKYIGGGSLPIASALEKASGAQSILLGTALGTDKIHAPNEHFSVSCFKMGYLMITQFVERLSTSN